MKPNKVEFGIEIWDAIYEKYFKDDEPEEENLFMYNNFKLV